jgi:hypothetical protein
LEELKNAIGILSEAHRHEQNREIQEHVYALVKNGSLRDEESMRLDDYKISMYEMSLTSDGRHYCNPYYQYRSEEGQTKNLYDTIFPLLEGYYRMEVWKWFRMDEDKPEDFDSDYD